MAKEEVAAEAADRAHQKTGLRAKGHAEIIIMAVIGLKWSIILNAARDATAMAHWDRQHHQFPRLGFATLEKPGKGNHSIQNDQHTGQIVHPSPARGSTGKWWPESNNK